MANRHFSGLLRGFLVVSILAFFPVQAVPADELDREFEFASGLVRIGFSDFADKVVQQVLKLHPDQKDRARLIQAEILISRAKFPEAEELVKTMGTGNPKAQAISLAVANGYYRIGETEKAKVLYNDFFKQYDKVPSDPDLLRFYQESAYQFGQMLELAGDIDGAIKSYSRVLSASTDKGTVRRLQAEVADLYVRQAAKVPFEQKEKLLVEAKKLCETIQWGGLDIWFGQSIITAANIDLVRGDKNAAQKTLRSNMDILKEIDKFIKEQGMPMSVSPMAGARFLLGSLYQEQGEAASGKTDKKEAIDFLVKALTEYYNVFAKYSESDWGPQAGLRIKEVEQKLQAMGKTVKPPDLGTYSVQAAAAQFKLADSLYRQKKYKEAIDEYLRNLNQFPESDASVNALVNLALCYADMDDKLLFNMIAQYLGERFANKPAAAMGLLAFGKYYFDKKDEPMYMSVYDTYLKSFPKHEKAAAVLFMLAGLKKTAGDQAGATAFFQRIVDQYPNDQYYTKALSQLAWSSFASSNYEMAVKGFGVFVKEAQPSPEKAQAQISMADSYRLLGKFKEALAEYEVVIQWLAPKNNPYATSAADAQKNAALLERSVFQRGYCLSRMKDPPESVPDYRARAIKAFDQFVALFPQADMASKAMSQKGTIQLELGQFDVAAKTFDELAQKYPASDEGKNALFSLARSAIEIKQYDQAKSAFEKMLKGGGTYSSDEFARLGQMMLDAGLYAEAIQAFQRVAGTAGERNLLERSLFGLGKSYYELKNYDQAIASLEELMNKYPKSGLFYDAKFTLGGSYRMTGKLDEAYQVMTDVFKYADKPILINKASYELGIIQKERKENQAALASFQRVALLADPKQEDLRPIIELCIMESIGLSMEMSLYQEVQESCDQYMSLFPTGSRIEEVRKLKAEARLKAAQAPAVPPPTAGNGTKP